MTDKTSYSSVKTLVFNRLNATDDYNWGLKQSCPYPLSMESRTLGMTWSCSGIETPKIATNL